MQRLKDHPVLLIGLGSLAASTAIDWLTSPNLPTGFLQGLSDGLGLACLYGYLLALRPVELRRS